MCVFGEGGGGKQKIPGYRSIEVSNEDFHEIRHYNVLSKELVINYGERWLHNVKIAGPKLFASPPLKTG